jgi:hypothetical protein
LRRERLPRKATRRTWSITDGRVAIGSIELRGEEYVAILPDHSIIGRYPTLARALEVFNHRRARGDGNEA